MKVDRIGFSSHLAVQRLVALSQHQLGGVPHEAADALQPIQVLFVLDLNAV